MEELVLSSAGKGAYSLTGQIDDLWANRRARLLLNSNFDITLENSEIRILCDRGVRTVSDVVKLAASYKGFTLKYDSQASEELQNFTESENLFEKFASAAAEIKNNHCDKSEFQYFTEILEKHMTSRRLYPLQLLSAYHLAFSQNGCNFSVPGAGKTSIVYGAYSYLKHQEHDKAKTVDKLLIIGPLSSFGPWENEYAECFGEKADCQRLTSAIPIESRKQYFFEKPKEISIISYASVVSLKEEIKSFLRLNRVMVVLDEAHKIKNTSGGITASAIMELAENCTSRVILTGTPAPNGYEDLYNLFRFIWPQNDVIKYSVGQLKDMSKADSLKKDTRVPRMLDNINPFFIRIRKSDLGLPRAIENAPIMVSMSDSQRRIYDFIEHKFVEAAVGQSSLLHDILIRAKAIRLQQAATNPALLLAPLSDYLELSEEGCLNVDDHSIMNDIMRFYDNSTPNKFQACLNLVKQIIDAGGKVVVWTIFIKNINTLNSFFSANGITSKTLYGETPVAEENMDEEAYSATREGIVKEFNDPNSSIKVLIANPFAVAESISLHKACHNAIYLERSFNCAHFMQSKDRIHRYGLEQNIITNYYYILSKDSVDETIHSRLATKERRMLEIIEQQPIPLFANISENDGDEDIKAILSDYVKRKSRKDN